MSALSKSSLAGLLTPLLPEQNVAEIVTDIRATDTAMEGSLGQLHYYLTIVEEAVSKASELGTQPGDQIAF